GLSVDGRLQLRLRLRNARLVLAREIAEEALACEAPELGRRALQALRGLELSQVAVALVDLLDVERLLEPGEVEVVLLVDVADEVVGLGAEPIEVAAGRRCGGHGCLGYGPVRELRITTDRHTQLLDITGEVRDAVDDASGSAVLVYVPHTTAGLTINEHADPM